MPGKARNKLADFSKGNDNNMDSTKALSEIVRLDHDITATFAMTIAAIVNILKLHTHPMSRSESSDRE